jgi:hypothetical protein
VAAERRTGSVTLDPSVTELGGNELTESESTDCGMTDEELTTLALAGDPDEPLDRDAVPVTLDPRQVPGPLPGWYMPPVMARRGKRWRTTVVLLLVAAFLVIEAVGLCSTYGQLVVG